MLACLGSVKDLLAEPAPVRNYNSVSTTITFWIFPSCMVTDDLPSPHRPVCLLARSQSSTFIKSHWHASFYLVFDRTIFPSPCISALNTFHSMRSSSLLLTCPYQFNLLSVIFLEAFATLVGHSRCSLDVFVSNLVLACHSEQPP